MNDFLKHLGKQVANKFVDLIALVVASIAIFISINQGKTQKEFERINKQPLLNIEFIKVDNAYKKGFKLSNQGFGPAIVISFKYYLNKKDFENDSNSFQKWLPYINDSLEYKFEDINFLTEGYIIGQNESSKDIFLLGTTANTHISEAYPSSFFDSNTAGFMEKLVIEIEYKSINPLDKYTYYLRFGENLKPSNHRESRE